MHEAMGSIIMSTLSHKTQFYKHNNIDCSNCPVNNFCCTLKVRLSMKDRLRIFWHHRLRTKQYADKLFDNSGWGIKLVNGDCFFLKRPKDKPAYCSIYNARPDICKKFPHFYEDINDCRDIVSKWKSFPKIVNQHNKSI